MSCAHASNRFFGIWTLWWWAATCIDWQGQASFPPNFLLLFGCWWAEIQTTASHSEWKIGIANERERLREQTHNFIIFPRISILVERARSFSLSRSMCKHFFFFFSFFEWVILLSLCPDFYLIKPNNRVDSVAARNWTIPISNNAKAPLMHHPLVAFVHQSTLNYYSSSGFFLLYPLEAFVSALRVDKEDVSLALKAQLLLFLPMFPTLICLSSSLSDGGIQ